MKLFTYKAYDKAGARADGEIESLDRQTAIRDIEGLELIPIEVTLVDLNQGKRPLFEQKLSLSDLEFMTSEISLLLAAGVRIDKGIDIIRKNKAKPALFRLLLDISNDLKAGNSLSASFRKYEDTFSPLYCNLVELGEASGNLDEVFAELAKDLKFRKALQGKIVSALAYPLVILSVCILSVFFIFNFIIPKMSSMFSGAQSLPWYTELMLSMSDWMVKYQWGLVFALFLFAFVVARMSRLPAVQRWWQSIILKIPGVGSTVVTIERIRFNSGMAMMIKSGIQIDRAIELSAGSIKNFIIKRELEIAKGKIKVGGALTPSLKQTSLYPSFFVSLLEVGEESGNLDKVFDEITERSRQDFESWTLRVTTLLEPLMILFMGGFVGGVVVTMLLSMVSLNEIGI